MRTRRAVALFTGAWIEIQFVKDKVKSKTPSRSLRARGLKLMWKDFKVQLMEVALFTGAWIEIAILL